MYVFQKLWFCYLGLFSVQLKQSYICCFPTTDGEQPTFSDIYKIYLEY